MCEGYSTRVEWQKSTNTAKAPVLLQSKDGELHPVGSSDSPQHHHHTLPNGGSPAPGSQADDQMSPPYRGSQAHPVAHGMLSQRSEEARHGAGGEHDRPPEHVSAGTWGKPSWPNPSNPAYLSDPHSKPEFGRVPPINDMRPDVEMTSPPSAVAHRSIIHPQSSSPQAPQQAQVQAQLALQHQASLHSRGRTEKEKMLLGEMYFASDSVLVNERERCRAACWRFNNSTNPSLDVSPEERTRLFRKIVQPDDIIRPSSPTGVVGERIIVEAPLTCDYGYNINIADDVCIGAHCTILDTCAVNIGKRCILGPNVSLYTATLPVDPRMRKGSQGPSMGKSITIEDDCWIGGGVTIL